MISFETHGKSRLPRMKNNQSKNLSHHLHNLHVSLLNQRNLIFPWLFKSHPVPSRLTSNINHLIFYRHLGVLSLSRICGEISLKTVHSTIIEENLKIGFQKYAPPSHGRQKLGENNNLAGITFSKIDSLSVKIGVGRESCYKSRYVIELAHLIQKHLSTHPDHISLDKNPTHLLKLLQHVEIKLLQIHSTALRQQCNSYLLCQL